MKMAKSFLIFVLFGLGCIQAAEYNASSRTPGTNFIMYEGQNDETNTPPLVNTTPGSEVGSYSGITTDDGTSHQYSVPNNGRYGHIRFELTIDETAAELSAIDISWNGSGNNAHNPRTDGANLYIWNYTAGNYELLDGTTSAAEVTLTGNISGSFADYLGGASSDTLVILVTTSDKRTSNRDNILSTDYFNVSTTGGVTPAASYYRLTTNASAIYCLAETVSLGVYDSGAALVTDYAETIVLDTQTGTGSWTLVTGNGTLNDATLDDGQATYVFDASDNGIAVFSLSYTSGSTPVDIEAYQFSDSSIRDDDTENNIAFAPSGFTLTASPLSNPPPAVIDTLLPNRRAGDDFAVYITAYGQTPNDPTCGVIETYTGAQTISLWSDYADPISGTITPTVNGSAIGSSEAGASSQSINFTNGQSSVTVKYKDVGSIALNFKQTGGAVDLTGSSNNFVVYPAEFLISISGNPASVDEDGAVFRKAGEAFTLQVQVLDSEGSETPNYGQEVTPEGIRVVSSTLVAPAAGRNGTDGSGSLINDTAFTLVSGASWQNTSIAFDEVGIIRLQAEVADGNYLGTGNVTSAETGNVGRFIPWRFIITDNTPMLDSGDLAWVCGFTYQDQPFSYSAGLAPEFGLSAVNQAGGVTINYGDTYWKYSGDLSNRTYASNVTGVNATLEVDPALSTVTLSGTDDLIDGTGLLTISDETLTYAKATVTPASGDEPFNADINITLAAADLVDADGVCYDDDNDGTCDDYLLSSITGTEVRYGRLAMSNGYGSELANLIMPVTTEYYTATGFQTHTSDSCSSGHADWTGFTLSDYSGNLSAGETTASFDAITLGVGNLTLSAPGTGNDGSVIVTAGTPNFLFYDYDGDGDSEAARATASFGIWPGRRPIIVIRERLRQ